MVVTKLIVDNEMRGMVRDHGANPTMAAAHADWWNEKTGLHEALHPDDLSDIRASYRAIARRIPARAAVVVMDVG